MRKIYKTALVVAAMAFASVAMAGELTSVSTNIQVVYSGQTFSVTIPNKAEVVVTNKTSNVVKNIGIKAAGTYTVADLGLKAGDVVLVELKNKSGVVGKYEYTYTNSNTLESVGAYTYAVGNTVYVQGTNVSKVTIIALGSGVVVAEAEGASVVVSAEVAAYYVVKAVVDGKLLEGKVFVQ